MGNVSADVWIALAGAVLNGAVVWGVVSTKLAWIRRDVDDLRAWRERCERNGPTLARVGP